MKNLFLTSALLAGVLAACGGSSSAPAESPKASEWKTMDHKQRAKYMAKVVLPKMKEVFVAFDPQFKDMDCKTCHGEGETDGTFKMPNPKLRVLPQSEEQFGTWVKAEPDLGRWGQFMGSKVEPMMAQLLGEEVKDEKTGKGEFDCLNCHNSAASDTPSPKPANPYTGA
ncbi:MAG TPA: hypothetical protein VFP84_07570 [Kofleriaceae bacterium]|nr:hypothetical protein [Kofleriaceae bacterium]